MLLPHPRRRHLRARGARLYPQADGELAGLADHVTFDPASMDAAFVDGETVRTSGM